MLIKTGIDFILVIIAIELIQLVSHRGICDIDDLLENGLGVLIGTGYYLLMRKLSAPKEPSTLKELPASKEPSASKEFPAPEEACAPIE